jgi:hypothetical protein
MAMSEAAKLFSQNGSASGSQQDGMMSFVSILPCPLAHTASAVNSAGATMLKLLLKNQASGMIGGGNSSAGGMSQVSHHCSLDCSGM